MREPMDKIENSREIFKSAWTVMDQNKKLILFPIVTTVLTLIIGTFFLTPILLRPTGHSYTQAAHWKTIGATFFTQDSMNRLAIHDSRHQEHLKATPTGVG